MKLFSPFGAVTQGVTVPPLLSLFSNVVYVGCSFLPAFAANLVVDPRTQRPKGFGFVSYQSEIEAEKAMKAMNGRVILSYSISTIGVCVCVCEIELNTSILDRLFSSLNEIPVTPYSM